MSSASELYTDSEHNTNAPTYHIEHNVPLPVKASKAPKEKSSRQSRYPFKSMSPGDSFFMPSVTVARANSALAMGRKIHVGSKWTVKSEDDGVRIWRRA